MASVYLGLLHHPTYNKNKTVIATAITNFDVHDIARAARTYDIGRYFVIHPLDSQLELVSEILTYWRDGFGAEYNADRKNALSILEPVHSLDECIQYIERTEGKVPYIVATDAGSFVNSVSYSELRHKIEHDTRPCLLLFGTGWGIEGTLMQTFDYILQPILGRGEYNHLSVRSAAAIILDRLLGEPWWLEHK